jgi:hypothetical protein
VAYGRKVKGILIHSLTDAAGMPLANRTTAANWNERAQLLPLLDAIHLRTGKHGRPRKRPKVIVTDKGHDARDLRQQFRTRGIRAQIPKRVWKIKKPRGAPSKGASRDSKPSERLRGSNASIAAWLCVGNVWLYASMRSSPLP